MALQRLGHAGGDPAGQDGVGPDALAAIFHRYAPDHGQEGALGRRIGLVARRALHRAHGGDGDDRSARVPRLAPRDHRLAGLAQGPEGAVQIDAHIGAPGFGAHLVKGLGRAADPGIGDHRIEPTKGLFRRRHGRDHLVFFADIDLLHQNPHAVGFQDRFGRGVALWIGAPNDNI